MHKACKLDKPKVAVLKRSRDIRSPYRPTSPFQFFLFLSKFLTNVLKKQVFFFSLKTKANFRIGIDPFLLGETVLLQSHTLLKVWSFVLTNLNRKSMQAFFHFFHFFFLEFSKKNLPEVSKFFSSVKELMIKKRLKGFIWQQKGKVAWKALSRKQNTLSVFGSYSKVNYNLATSDSGYTYSSITGTVSFRNNLFY